MVQVKRSFALAILIVVAFSVIFQVWQIWQFVNAGGRFTDADGQRLCERVAELEKHSIGFQQSGIVSPPCAYVKKP